MAMPAEDLQPKTPEAIVLRVVPLVVLAAIIVAAARYFDIQQPFIGYGLGGIFFFLLTSRPSMLRLALAGAVATAIAAIVIGGRLNGVSALSAQAAGALGLSSLLVLSFLVIWNGRGNEPAAFRALLPGAAVAFVIFAALLSFGLLSFSKPKTLDLYAYVFDGSLGQPTFLLARFLNKNSWLLPFVKFSYQGIVLALAALYAGIMLKREKSVWELSGFIVLPAAVACAFFFLFPVCGPRYTFAYDFPKAFLPYSMLHRLALESIPLSTAFPRNGAVSLFLVWSLMLCFNSRGRSRWIQAASAAVALVTIFDTLATGEHYFFDLVASMPFAVLMYALVTLPASTRQRERWLSAAAGGALFLGLLCIGRFGIPWMLTSRIMVWAIVVGTSTASIWLTIKVPANTAANSLESSPPPNQPPKSMAAAAGRTL